MKKILEQQPDEGGGEVRIPAGIDGSEDLVVELPTKKIGLPQLQRYRRAYIGLSRGGLGWKPRGNLPPVGYGRALSDISTMLSRRTDEGQKTRYVTECDLSKRSFGCRFYFVEIPGGSTNPQLQ